jgi:hypothetical protein
MRLTDVRSVALGATVSNVLAGKLGEYLARPAIVSVAIVASAVGMFATIMFGERTIVADQEVSGANRFPVLPDDISVQDAGLAGQRLTINLRNSTGGAITVNTVVDVQYVA